MNKFKALLHSWAGLPVNGNYSATDTFKMLPASVAGANGSMHRYCSALMLTAKARFLSDETAGPELDAWDVLDFLIGKLTWTRYSGSFVPQPLAATEIAAFLGVQGCVTPSKEAVVIHITPWQAGPPGAWYCDAYASIIVPITPSMFSTAHAKSPTDAPWSATLLGASSAYTIQGWRKLEDVSEDITCPSGISLEASALCLDTPRVIVCRPIEYKKFSTSDDPAVLPSQFCKMPTIFAVQSDFKAPIAAFLSDTVVPLVRVDGRQMSERLTGRAYEYADLWYRDDATRVLQLAGPWGGMVYPLRTPCEASKMILQPAGSQWQVEGIGQSQGSKVSYYYTPVYDPSGPLVSYQLSQMGVDPNMNRIGNVKINSNSRAGMSLTEEEQTGIPQTLGDSAFVE